MEERFDICTRDRVPSGKSVARGSALAEGEFHVVAMAAIFTSEGKILLTRRSPHKTAAGKWECTAGSVLAGETSEQAIVREIREEIGLALAHERTLPLATFLEDDAIFDLFLFRVDCGIGDLVLQREEVDDAMFATRPELVALIEAGQATRSLREIVRLCEAGMLNVAG